MQLPCIECHYRKTSSSTMEAWHLTTDKGLKALSNNVAYSNRYLGILITYRDYNEESDRPLMACDNYQKFASFTSLAFSNMLNISDKQRAKDYIEQTENFIRDLESDFHRITR